MPAPFNHITSGLRKATGDLSTVMLKGRVKQVVGTAIHTALPSARIGDICMLRDVGAEFELPAEVVSFTGETAVLVPIGEMRGISSRTEVIPTGQAQAIPVGEALIGRVLDCMGQPIDGHARGALVTEGRYAIHREPPHPLTRRIIQRPLTLGISALDGLLTCGEGQRIGIFAAAGVGKSTLLTMMARGADVDVTVLALIGERGREVREFIERDLGPEGLKTSIVVCATSDKAPMERARAAYVATAIAEYFRSQGKKVLLLMDSITRFARAQREIGLAAGEPPARRGFPPSVFAILPKLVERSGSADRGSITAFYTVLVEGDDMTEPIADEVKSLVDGHIVLSSKLAVAAHYPAIDILASASRVMGAVTGSSHIEAAGKIRALLAKFADIELLLKVGEYQEGSDMLADEAVRKIDSIRQFLSQGPDSYVTFDDTLATMQELAA
ncbi:MAG: type III secretion system ATPase SctN [Geminicoccaceae bacterium]